MDSKKLVLAWMPTNLIDAVEHVNGEMEKRYGLTLSLSDAQRIMCLVYARSALAAVEGHSVLSAGEFEQRLCAFITNSGYSDHGPLDQAVLCDMAASAAAAE
jgi:hypothetical protein